MGNKFSREEIFNKLKEILIEELEIPEEKIKDDANLFDDLELDSIDAVDIAVRMQEYTDKKLPPGEFNKIKTVKDVVDTVYDLLEE